jgi:hypothetical protein
MFGATDSVASEVGAERGRVGNGFSGGEQRAKMMLSGMTVLYDVCRTCFSPSLDYYPVALANLFNLEKAHAISSSVASCQQIL